ncbi:MAG: hypothetical protein ACI8ZB_002603 [Desulforhopalus sp.]|jgi:hypothetical protein
MKKILLLAFLTVTLFTQLTYGATSEEGPLTLMPVPQKNGQSSNPQQVQQMPQLQQGQGQGQPMQMYDIYGVIPTKASVPYLYIILGALVLLLAGALIYWWLKKRRRAYSAPVIPPWERALTDLAEAKALQIRGQGRLYMDRASQILRNYIEQRFAIKTTRKTTREFLYSLGGRTGSDLSNYRVELQSCLEQADMAKFAHQVQDEKNLLVMEQAVSTFVQSTRPADGDKGGEK